VWNGGTSFELLVPELIVEKGEKLALVGFSGCGKSTLLDLLAMILQPDEAEQFLFAPDSSQGMDINQIWSQKDVNQLADARLKNIGYVLQTGGLLPFLSVYENISLTPNALGVQPKDKIEALCDQLAIKHHLSKLPVALSVGERQRVAIARAMAHNPGLILGDEPTASLDPINAERIMQIFIKLAEEQGMTLIVATHEWKRVEELGFRKITFELEDLSSQAKVRARVCG
jgi:putative ABC transport system ATP-binding protein